MNEKPKRFWNRQFGPVFWLIVLAAVSFCAAAPLRVASGQEHFHVALIFAAIFSACIVLAVTLLIVLLRWLRSGGGLRRFFRAVACIAALTVTFFSIELSDSIKLFPGESWSECVSIREMLVDSLIRTVALVLAAIPLILFVRWFCCRRNFRRFLIGALTLIALTYVEENVRGKWAWERFRREWEAKGERFDRASVIPPLVPDDQNFALTPIVASSYAFCLDPRGHEVRPYNTNVVDRLDMSTFSRKFHPLANSTGDWQKSTLSDLKGWQRYYRELAAKTKEFPVPPQPQSPAADVLLVLSKYDSTIEELRQASRLRYSRFPLSYDKEDPFSMLLPHLAALKRSAQVLQLRALAELQNEQSDKALDDIKLSVRLTEAIRTEPILISHLVRIAIVNLVLQPIWEGFAEQRWPDSQLIELDQELGGFNLLADYKRAMRDEMVFQVVEADFLRRHSELLPAITKNVDPSEPELLSISRFVPTGWFYQNQLRCARMMAQCYLQAVDLNQGTISPAFLRDADAKLEADVSCLSPYNVLERLLVPAVVNSARKFAVGQSYVDLARVACALERYRLAHGEYPASLDVLAPQFIAKIPQDIIGGQPLKYRCTDDGQFVLYSIGWNETDDGGEIALTKTGSIDTANGDWVWRYPAK